MDTMNQMSDLGELYPSSPCGCSDCQDREDGKGDQKKHYPRESFTTKQMPDLKGLNVGDKVKIVFECEVCSVSQGDEYGDGPIPGGQSDNSDDEPVTVRISLKMLQGQAVRMSSDTKEVESPTDPETVQGKIDKKAKDFNSNILDLNGE